MEIKGKLITKLAETSGTSKAGKDWVKQDFVIETQETYPKKVCISVMGEKVNTLKNIKVGEVITAHINIESREYNGKYYTTISAWKLDLNQATERQPAPLEPYKDDKNGDDLPF